MLTGFFRHRARSRADSSSSTDDQLRRLLQSPALHPHRFRAQCEIGPFIVAHVCRERSLVVELLAQPGLRERQEQRAAFLGELGYTVVHVCVRELQRRPRCVLRRIRSVLQRLGSRQ